MKMNTLSKCKEALFRYEVCLYPVQATDLPFSKYIDKNVFAAFLNTFELITIHGFNYGIEGNLIK